MIRVQNLYVCPYEGGLLVSANDGSLASFRDAMVIIETPNKGIMIDTGEYVEIEGNYEIGTIICRPKKKEKNETNL